MDLLSGLITNLVSASIGVGSTWLWKSRISHTPFAKIAGVKKNEPTIIVVPERPLIEGVVEPKTKQRAYVTYEDMLAANYIERTLTLAGIPDNNIRIRNICQFQEDGEYKQQNLILICSPKANKVTKDALEKLNSQLDRFEVSFKQIQSSPDRWIVSFQGGNIESPSYEQEKQLIDNGKIPEDGLQEDYSLLARVKNPWNPDKTLLMVSGIRGIGTWGAARCLRELAPQLLRKTKGRDFACITKVAVERYKIIRYELTDHFSVF